MTSKIEIRFHAPPKRVKVVIEVDIETTIYPAPSTFVVGTEEEIARHAVVQAIFRNDEYKGEHDERGPYRTMFDDMAKIRMRRGAEEHL